MSNIVDPNSKDPNKTDGSVNENLNGLDSTPATVVVDEDLDKPYLDKRTITVSPITSYSNFREANKIAIPQKVNYIGSCVASSVALSSVKGEMARYFPSIIGISADHDSFMDSVKNYLNNIQIKVDSIGKTFDISFMFNTKKDYNAYRKKEKEIEDAYDLVKKTDFVKVSQAMKKKISDINALESTKYLYGDPVNVIDYLMYRHCLLYKDIAKDMTFINAESKVRFYFKDDSKELELRKRLHSESKTAKSNYIACCGNKELFDSMFVQYLILSNYPVNAYINMDIMEKENLLDKFSTNDPVKFNKLFKDKDCKLKGNIELLIAKGELTRLQYNQNIVDSDNNVIGANMNEVIAWFKNPSNKDIVNTYYAKLKHT